MIRRTATAWTCYCGANAAPRKCGCRETTAGSRRMRGSPIRRGTRAGGRGAVRGDYVNDENGARTSGFLGFPVNTGQKFRSATATLNLRAWPNALVRPEVRYD